MLTGLQRVAGYTGSEGSLTDVTVTGGGGGGQRSCGRGKKEQQH
jgi:hypothetical protein